MIRTLGLYLGFILVFASSATGDDTITVHGQTETQDTDPLNPTAATQTVPVERDAISVGSVLDDATGVEVQRDGSMGRAESIQLRGALGHQVQVLLDDMPLLVTRGQRVDLSTLPTAFFSQALVTRGGASVDYGSGAQGGAIQLKSRILTLKDPQFLARVGAFNYRSAGILVPVKRRKSRMLFGAQLESAKGDFAFIDTNNRRRRRANNEHTKINVTAAGRWHPSKLGTLKLFLDLFGDQRGEPGPMEFPNPSAESQRKRVLMGIQLRLRAQKNGSVQHTVALIAQTRQFAFTDPNPIFAGDPSFFQMTDLSRSLRLQSQFQISPTLSMRSSLGATSDQIKTRKQASVSRHRLSANVVGHLEWIATERLLLSSGGRLEHTPRRTEFIPRVGLGWAIAHDTQLSINWAKMFRLPSLDELYYEGVGVAGNRHLTSERGQSADFTIAYRPTFDTLRYLSASVFLTDFDSLIYFAPIDAYRYRADNHPGGIVYGFEATSRLNLHVAMLQTNYKFQQSRSAYNTSIALPFRASHLAHLKLEREILGGSAHMGLRHVSSRTADVFGNRKIPGYLELNAGLAWKVGQHWHLSVLGNNLFDGLIHRDFPTLPRPSRSIFLSLSYR